MQNQVFQQNNIEFGRLLRKDTNLYDTQNADRHFENDTPTQIFASSTDNNSNRKINVNTYVKTMRKLTQEDLNSVDNFHNAVANAEHCFAYARMLNQLDYKWMRGRFENAAQYESQSVLRALCGRRSILYYLKGKIDTLKSCWPQNIVIAEIGKDPQQGHPCVIVYQIKSIKNRKEKVSPVMYVLLQLENTNFIKRCDLITCAPHPDSASRTGIFPGADPALVQELQFASPVVWP